MPYCRCGEWLAVGCQCTMASSTCFSVSGSGSNASPYTISPVIATHAEQLLACTSSGLLAPVPTVIERPPAVWASKTSPQAIPTDVQTPIHFARERFDTDSMHDILSFEEIFNINTAGVYAVTGAMNWEGSPDGERRTNLRVNGSLTIAQDERDTIEEDVFSHGFGTVWKFAEGDTLELLVNQNSGATLQIVSGYITMVRIARG